MTGRFLQSGGLFLAALAAFSLAVGHPQAVLAAEGDPDLAAIHKFAETPEGKEVLARAGLSPEHFRTMVGRLSAGQRRQLEGLICQAAPEARLRARLVDVGYTPAEADERIALLTEGEIARFADDPEATTAGTGVATVGVIILVALAALVAAWYFVAIEEPVPEEPEGAPESVPAK